MHNYIMCINVYNIISIYMLYNILNYHCYFILLFLYSLDSDCVFFTIQRSRKMHELGSLLSWLSLGVRPLHLRRFSSEMASNLRLHKCATYKYYVILVQDGTNQICQNIIFTDSAYHFFHLIHEDIFWTTLITNSLASRTSLFTCCIYCNNTVVYTVTLQYSIYIILV